MIEQGVARAGQEAVADPGEAGLPQHADGDPREGSRHASAERWGFEALCAEPGPSIFPFEIEDGIICTDVSEAHVVVEKDAATKVGIGGFGVAGKGEEADVAVVKVKELEDVQNASGGAGEDGGDGAVGGKGRHIVGGLALEEGDAVGAGEVEQADGGAEIGGGFERVRHGVDYWILGIGY